MQPNTSSSPHSQPRVATATLTLCEPHSKQVESGEESCCVCNCIILSLQGTVCVCIRVSACTRMYACVSFVTKVCAACKPSASAVWF